jgi:hypothetical protein
MVFGKLKLTTALMSGIFMAIGIPLVRENERVYDYEKEIKLENQLLSWLEEYTQRKYQTERKKIKE